MLTNFSPIVWAFLYCTFPTPVARSALFPDVARHSPSGDAHLYRVPRWGFFPSHRSCVSRLPCDFFSATTIVQAYPSPLPLHLFLVCSHSSQPGRCTDQSLVERANAPPPRGRATTVFSFVTFSSLFFPLADHMGRERSNCLSLLTMRQYANPRRRTRNRFFLPSRTPHYLPSWATGEEPLSPATPTLPPQTDGDLLLFPPPSFPVFLVISVERNSPFFFGRVLGGWCQRFPLIDGQHAFSRPEFRIFLYFFLSFRGSRQTCCFLLRHPVTNMSPPTFFFSRVSLPLPLPHGRSAFSSFCCRDGLPEARYNYSPEPSAKVFFLYMSPVHFLSCPLLVMVSFRTRFFLRSRSFFFGPVAPSL